MDIEQVIPLGETDLLFGLFHRIKMDRSERIMDCSNKKLNIAILFLLRVKVRSPLFLGLL